MREQFSRLHLGGKVSVFVFVITAIQPFMDVISYFCISFGDGNTPLFLRGLLLTAILAAGCAASESKRLYLIMAAMLFSHAALHLTAATIIYGLSVEELVSDASNLIRIYSFPITAASFVSLLKREPEAVRSAERGALSALFVIVFVEALAVITGTDPHSYPNKAIGVLGWFYFANSQSAILSMLYPIALISALTCRRRRAFAVTLSAGGAALFFLATRLAYFSLVFTLSLLAAVCLYLSKRRGAPLKKTALILAAALFLSVAALPASPMAENIRQTGQNAVKKQEHIDSLAESGGTRAVYAHYLPALVDRFGFRRTESLYGGSTRVDDVCDVRRMKIAYCRLLTEDFPAAAIAGHPISEMTHGGKNHDVENDLNGIFYLTGASGLCLLLSFFLYFAFRILRFLLRDRGKAISLRRAAYISSLLFGCMHAYFTAGVLRRPNASFFLALTLALIYSETNKRNTKGTAYDENGSF